MIENKEINLKLGDIKEPLPKRIINKFCQYAFKDANLYPQNYGNLINGLAKKHDVEPENILLTNGADEGIELIARAFGQDILIFPPTYYEFLDAPKRNGLNYETINCFGGRDYTLKYEESDVKNRSLIYLCNPNNPFGILTKNEIIEIANKTKGVVAVDETYIDFNGESVIDEFKQTPNILVVRSFSKGYSLAGLRVGYIAGEKSLIDAVAKRKLFSNVSSASVNAAMVVLDEEKYFKKLVTKIKNNKTDFEGFLRANEFGVIGSETNKIFIKFPSTEAASEFHNYLSKNKIATNLGNGFGTCGLDETYVQFAFGTKEQMARVREVIEQYR